jgi:nicotinamide riboside transporter PnuC
MAGLPKAELKKGVVAASAGNHAQGVALAAAKLGTKAVIVMPRTTPQIKVDAVRNLGGKVVEQWLVWLVVDLVTVGLYLYKDLPYTAGLYALYSALAVAGYLRWRRQARA